MKKIFTLLVVAISVTVMAQKSVLLRLNYEKGDSYMLTMKMKQEMTVMNNDMVMKMKTKVTAKKDGIAETENTFEKIIIDAKAQGKSVHYDSDMKESEMDEMAKRMHTQMKSLKESVVLMMFDNLGNTTEVKIKSGNADVNQFKQNTNTMVYPKEAVKVGSTWSREKEIQGMKMTYIYKVKEIGVKEVTIDVTGKVTGLATGDVKGVSVVDKKTGTMVKSDMVTNVSAMGTDSKTTINMINKKL